MTSEEFSRVRLAIAIPTYNESSNIKKLIPRIRDNTKKIPNLYTTVYIIDDNSPDGTAKVAKKLSEELNAKNFNVKVLLRKKKEGLGKAYIYGFKEILKSNVDLILQMDADLSHDPKYLPDFIEAAKEGADFIVGSRYIKGGDTPDWTFKRKLLSQGGNTYTRFILSSRISDYTGGFNMYSKELINKINIDSLRADGYGFLIELKYKALKNCNKVKQIPIVFMDRQHGYSKLPRSTILHNLLLVLKLKFGE